MALTYTSIAVVGSREFTNYLQLKRVVDSFAGPDDLIVSGGAVGADSMAQRYAKENGLSFLAHYPRWRIDGIYQAGAGFLRNKKIVESADIVLAFYALDSFQKGGTANTISWCRLLNKEFYEYEEERTE